jgi:membrane carboxypeptidase/penicillin-binding protein PbpC
MPANGWCPSRRHERLPSSNEPPCSWHHQGDDGLLVIWPPHYRQWARQQGLLAESRAASALPARVATSAPVQPARGYTTQPSAFSIVNPPSGATYFIDPTLRREFQTLSLRVVAASPGPIEWLIAGRPIGSSSSESALEWPLTPGVHRIVARDGRGRTAESSVTVK